MSSALKVKDVADELGCSDFTVHELIKSGALPAVNIGSRERKHWRIRRDDLDAYLRGATQPVGGDAA